MDAGDYDDLDLKIVERLFADGRASYSSLAEQLDVAASTIASRIQRMEADGAIRGYRPEIGYEAFGVPVTAVIRLKTNHTIGETRPSEFVWSLMETVSKRSGTVAESVEDQIQSQWFSKTHLTSVYRVTGTYDWLTVWRCSDIRSVGSAVQRLRSQPGTIDIKTEIAVEKTERIPSADIKMLTSNSGFADKHNSA